MTKWELMMRVGWTHEKGKGINAYDLWNVTRSDGESDFEKLDALAHRVGSS